MSETLSEGHKNKTYNPVFCLFIGYRASCKNCSILTIRKGSGERVFIISISSDPPASLYLQRKSNYIFRGWFVLYRDYVTRWWFSTHHPPNDGYWVEPAKFKNAGVPCSRYTTSLLVFRVGLYALFRKCPINIRNRPPGYEIISSKVSVTYIT
jgi:hypothetical protein